MCVTTLRLNVSTYVGEGLEQTCTVRDLTERDFTTTQLAALGHIIANAGFDPEPPAARTPAARTPAARTPALATAPKPKPAGDRVADVAAAKQQGFTGAMCTNCYSLSMKRNGACEVCVDCGTTTGCS